MWRYAGKYQMTAKGNEATRAYIERTLAENRVFKEVSPDDLNELVRVAKATAIQRSKPLFSMKGAKPEIYIISTGAVAAIQLDQLSNKGTLTSLYGPGDLVGLESAFLQNSSHDDHSVPEFRALTNISVIALPVTDFIRIFRRSSELALTTLSETNSTLNQTRIQFSSALHNPLEIRLAAFFSQICNLIKTDDWLPSANIGRFPQTAIAEMLGVTREHVNRTLTMWERSGLIFQTKNGDILIENRKRLSSLAASKHTSAASNGESEWLWEIDAHLDNGLYAEAHDLAMEAAKRSPKDNRFKHRAVIATARGGATQEALQLIETFKLSENYADEEIACLRPRILRDLAYAKKETTPARKPLEMAAKEYLKAFKGSGGSYSGVNAASTFAMLGDLEKAATIAKKVSFLAQKNLIDLDEDEIDYWQQCTIGECSLIQGNLDEAGAHFANACKTIDVTPGKKAQTRRQLQRLSKRLPIDNDWIETYIPQGKVLFFSGPMAAQSEDDNNSHLKSTENSISEFLVNQKISSGCGSLAAGADIIIAEKLLDHGAQLQVYLPSAPLNFMKSSVEPFGPRWTDRFIACMKRATTVDWNRRAQSGNAAYDLGAIAAMGRTIRHAEELQTSPIGFFSIKKGVEAHNSLTQKNANRWTNLNLDMHTVEENNANQLQETINTERKNIVFAVIITANNLIKLPSKIQKAQVFEYINEKTSLIILGFSVPKHAIDVARIYQNKVPANIRIWLDVGIFDDGHKTNLPDIFSTSICRPITDGKQIYASDIFTTSNVVMGDKELEFDYIGYTNADEKVEPCPLYLLSK